jgi:hypothetical protein
MMSTHKIATYRYIFTLLIVAFGITVAVSQDWNQYGSSANDSLYFSTYSPGPVDNNPPSKVVELNLDKPETITLIRTYHWNYGRGQDPGADGYIRILDRNGNEKFKSQLIYAENGVGGVTNVYWVAYGLPPIIEKSGPMRSDYPPLNWKLETGKYIIDDSDRSTWSYNLGSGEKGITLVYALNE